MADLRLVVDHAQDWRKLRDGRLIVDQDDDPPLSVRAAMLLLVAASVAIWAAIWGILAFVVRGL